MIALPSLAGPADVVRHLGAVQAQDYGQALWAIGLRTKGIFFQIMVANGQVVGTWKRIIGPKQIAVRFEPFAPLAPVVMDRFRVKAEQYAAFMGQPIAILS